MHSLVAKVNSELCSHGFWENGSLAPWAIGAWKPIALLANGPPYSQLMGLSISEVVMPSTLDTSLRRGN